MYHVATKEILQNEPCPPDEKQAASAELIILNQMKTNGKAMRGADNDLSPTMQVLSFNIIALGRREPQPNFFYLLLTPCNTDGMIEIFHDIR